VSLDFVRQCDNMDKDTSDMKQNPRETANIFNVLFFWFVKILV